MVFNCKKRANNHYEPIYGPKPSTYNPYFPEITPETKIIVDLIEEKGFLNYIKNLDNLKQNNFIESLKQEIFKRIKN